MKKKSTHKTPAPLKPGKRASAVKGSPALPPVERIERWPVARLLPYAKNPREHTPEQVDLIAASLKEFGQTQLVVIDERGELIAGHGRILAAQKLGIETLIVGVAQGWSEVRKKQYRIADNQTALRSRWDDALLQGEMQEIRLAGGNLDLLAFEPGQLEALMMDFESGENSLSEEWQGMPEFDAAHDARAFKSVMVHFQHQKAMDNFLAATGAEMTMSTKYLWFPAIPKKSRAENRYQAKPKKKK